MKKSIDESVRRTRYQVQLYAKEAGKEGHDIEGRVKECHDDVGREEPLLIAIDVQVEPHVEPAGGGHDV